MPRRETAFPTKLELQILKVLWKEFPLPVREVQSRLLDDANKPLAHSSVITILNIMHRKGLLTRKKDGKAFLFAPKVKESEVRGGMLKDLRDRLFNGSPQAMMLNLLETSDLNDSDLTDLRKLINQKSKGKTP